MEHGRPLAAALCFKRLAELPQAAEAFEPLLSVKLAICWVRAGMPSKALSALGHLDEKYADATVTIAGRERRVSELRQPGSRLVWVLREGPDLPPDATCW